MATNAVSVTSVHMNHVEPLAGVIGETAAGLLFNNSYDGSDAEDAIVAMNTSHFYADEWAKYFSIPNYRLALKKAAFQGGLRSCRFRSICWQLFLRCIPEDQSKWVAKCIENRGEYEKLRTQFVVNPRNEVSASNLSLNNPLSQEQQSTWNQYFLDSDLKVTIHQDVIRTFPEIEFFQSDEIRELMVNVLFCYARGHPHMSYRQGMHELLAPIIFVIHSDQQAFLHASELDCLEKTVKCLLDPACLEHDSYYLFCKLMEVVQNWYIIRDAANPKLPEMTVSAPFSRPQDVNSHNMLVKKLTFIQDKLLRDCDHSLYIHLEKMEIAPQIYGIRWLRLLFGREFPLQDLLVIWDVIFAADPSFQLVDYIFLSMLIFIRDLLLTSDYASCLSHLMRYPAVTDVHFIIDQALHLREPNIYPKPTGYSCQMLQNVVSAGGRHDMHRAPSSQRSSSTSRETMSTHSVTRQFARPQTLSLERNHCQTSTSKSSSEPGTCESRSSPEIGDYIRLDPEFCTASDLPEADDSSQIMSTSTGSLKAALLPALSSLGTSVTSAANATSNLVATGLVSRSLTNDIFQTKESELLPNRGKGDDALNDTRSKGAIRKNNVSRKVVRDPRVRSKSSVEMDELDHSGIVVLTANSHPLACDDDVTDYMAKSRSKRSGASGGRNLAKQVDELQQEVYMLRTQISDVQSMRSYCVQKMTTCLDRLQEGMLQQQLKNEDEMFIALAGIKQARDILKGTLRFNPGRPSSSDSGLAIDDIATDAASQDS